MSLSNPGLLLFSLLIFVLEAFHEPLSGLLHFGNPGIGFRLCDELSLLIHVFFETHDAKEYWVRGEKGKRNILGESVSSGRVQRQRRYRTHKTRWQTAQRLACAKSSWTIVSFPCLYVHKRSRRPRGRPCRGPLSMDWRRQSWPCAGTWSAGRLERPVHPIGLPTVDIASTVGLPCPLLTS